MARKKAQVIPIGRRPRGPFVEFGGPVDRTQVSLRFFGPDLDPEAVSQALEVPPSLKYRKDEVIRGRRSGHTRVAAVGAWIIDSEAPESAGVEDQIWHLFGRISDDEDVWRDLTSRFEGDLFVGIFMDAINRGFELSPRLLSEIGERGLRLEFDLYGPDGAARRGG